MKKMRVLMVEPGKHPYELEMEHSLAAMYAALECETITATYPWEDAVGLVTDDEGLFTDKLPNRYIPELQQFIKGNFFLCGLSEEDFADLPEELMEKYKKRFWQPETFLRTAGGNLAIIRFDDGSSPEDEKNQKTAGETQDPS